MHACIHMCVQRTYIPCTHIHTNECLAVCVGFFFGQFHCKLGKYNSIYPPNKYKCLRGTVWRQGLGLGGKKAHSFSLSSSPFLSSILLPASLSCVSVCWRLSPGAVAHVTRKLYIISAERSDNVKKRGIVFEGRKSETTIPK